MEWSLFIFPSCTYNTAQDEWEAVESWALDRLLSSQEIEFSHAFALPPTASTRITMRGKREQCVGITPMLLEVRLRTCHPALDRANRVDRGSIISDA